MRGVRFIYIFPNVYYNVHGRIMIGRYSPRVGMGTGRNLIFKQKNLKRIMVRDGMCGVSVDA